MDAPENGDVTTDITQQADHTPNGFDETLKYHLLGPSLTKAGQEKVDQQKVRYVDAQSCCAAQVA